MGPKSQEISKLRVETVKNRLIAPFSDRIQRPINTPNLLHCIHFMKKVNCMSPTGKGGRKGVGEVFIFLYPQIFFPLISDRPPCTGGRLRGFGPVFVSPARPQVN